MKIRNDNGILIGAAFALASDKGGDMAPEAIVLHHTAGGSAQGSIAHLTNDDEVYVSAHFVIGRDGAITQLVPCNRVAYHAGRSRFEGREAFNGFSIGIEMANWGFLKMDDKGRAVTWAGKVLRRSEIYRDPEPQHADLEYWESAPLEQLNTCRALCRALKVTYPAIRQVVGHYQIAGFRGKTDPGPPYRPLLAVLNAEMSSGTDPEPIGTGETDGEACECVAETGDVLEGDTGGYMKVSRGVPGAKVHRIPLDPDEPMAPELPDEPSAPTAPDEPEAPVAPEAPLEP